MLSQYLYVSTAPNLSRDEVDAIMSTSAQNNPARGITGLLLYNGRNFLQLLEGENDVVKALVDKIATDPRHSGFAIIHQGEIAERSCPEWAMKRVFIAESVADRREALERDLPDNLEATVRQMVLNFAVLN